MTLFTAGDRDGNPLGRLSGLNVDFLLGARVELFVGSVDGLVIGFLDGITLGLFDCIAIGFMLLDRYRVGVTLGDRGTGVGFDDGEGCAVALPITGESVGETLRPKDGFLVGNLFG